MMNDSFSVELRQHLLETANERPGDGRLAAIAEGVAVTGQHHPLVSRLPWSPTRLDPFPTRAIRYGVLVVALIVALIGAALLAAGGFASRTVFTGGESAVLRIIKDGWYEIVNREYTSCCTCISTEVCGDEIHC